MDRFKSQKDYILYKRTSGERKVMTNNVNCEIDCVDGCVLGEKCPNKEYQKEASKFINDTSLEKMHEIAEIARRRKLTEPPKWVIPDDI